MTLKLLGLLISQICITQIFGQYILDTPDGKKVKLNSNGTWVFLNSDSLKKGGGRVPETSTAKYTSRFKKYEFWYDPTQWMVDTVKKTNSYTWDADFYSMDYAIQGYCLESRLSMPIENLEESIREQWQSSGEIKSFSSFKDTINNLPVAVFEMQYRRSDVTYVYKGIVYSDTRGSFQFIVGTQKEIFEEDKSKIELLLKGLIKK
jgi:hypothetical protein